VLLLLLVLLTDQNHLSSVKLTCLPRSTFLKQPTHFRCSSMVGGMNEQGPFTLAFRSDGSPGYELKRNPYSWNEGAHLVFVEQPIRVGFSVAAANARRIKDEGEISQDFARFVKSFLTVFDEFQGAEVFITGESYAGMYIPYMASYILKHQSKSNLLGEININLKGVAIGNGAIDPYQDLSYAEYAYSHGLIPQAARDYIEDYAEKCYDKATSQKGKKGGKSADCNTLAMVLEAAGQPNEYDTGTFNGYTRIIQPGGVFERFFNDPIVQEFLHVRGNDLPGINFVPESSSDSSFYAPERWVVCNDQVTEEISKGDVSSSIPALKYLIAQPDFRVLLYSGERDLNTNFLGTLHVLEKGMLDLKRPWTSAARSLWRFNGDVAGEHFSIDNFAFLIVRNSGHLLPMDVPQQALDLLVRFINDQSFADVVLPSEDSYRRKKAGQEAILSVSQSSSLSALSVVLVFGFACAAALGIFVYLRTRNRGLSLFGTRVSYIELPKTFSPLGEEFQVKTETRMYQGVAQNY